MTTVQNTTSSATTQGKAGTGLPKTMLKQEDFLKLMIAQMKNQDPTKPLEGQEYLGQLAQFSTLSSIQELQKSFDTLAQSLMSIQTGQATNMVGKQVLSNGSLGYYTPGQSLSGQVTLPDSVSNLTLKVFSTSGQLLNTINLGSRSAGQADFSLDSQGMSAGVYKIVAEGTVDGNAQQFETQIWNRVESVSVGQAGQSSSLKLAGVGNVNMNSIREIR